MKDLEDCFGENTIPNNKKGVIIKIPKDFKDNEYDLSLFVPNLSYPFTSFKCVDIQISYDYKEFIVPTNDTKN